MLCCCTGDPCSPDGSGHEDGDEDDVDCSAGEDEDLGPVDDEDEPDITDPFSREGDVTLNSSTGQVVDENDTPTTPGHAAQEGSPVVGVGRTDSPLQSRPGHFDEFTEQSPSGHTNRNTMPVAATAAAAALDIQIQMQRVHFHRNHHHSSQPGNNHHQHHQGEQPSPPSVVVGGSCPQVDQEFPRSSISSSSSSSSSSSFGETRVNQFSPSPSTSSSCRTRESDNDIAGHLSRKRPLEGKDIYNPSVQPQHKGGNSRIVHNPPGEEAMCLKRKLFTIDSIIGTSRTTQGNHEGPSCTETVDRRTQMNVTSAERNPQSVNGEMKQERKKERDIFDQIPSPPPKITDIEKLKARELSYMSYPYPASYAYLAGRQVGQINPAYAASLAAVREGHPALSSAVPLGGLTASPCYQLGGTLGVPAGHPYTLPGSPYINTAQLSAYQHGGVSAIRGPIELSHSPSTTIKLESRDLQAK